MQVAVKPDIRLKRAYEPPAPEDGCRILVDRLWPRGLRKANAAIDCWLKDLHRAPSYAVGSVTTPPVGRNSVVAIVPSCQPVRTR